MHVKVWVSVGADVGFCIGRVCGDRDEVVYMCLCVNWNYIKLLQLKCTTECILIPTILNHILIDIFSQLPPKIFSAIFYSHQHDLLSIFHIHPIKVIYGIQ